VTRTRSWQGPGQSDRRLHRRALALGVALGVLMTLVGAVPAGAVTACSSSVPATMEPTNLWPRRGPSFTVFANPTGGPPSVPAERLAAALQEAIAEWNDDPASAIAITYGGLTSDTSGFHHDGTDVVFWRDLDPATVGATSLYSGPFGVVAGFDTALNRDLLYGADVGGFDLTTTLRHELGHAIGLCHDSAPDELMFPSQQHGAAGARGLTARALGEVAAQYPNQELTTIADDGRGLPTVIRTQRNALFARSRNPVTGAWGEERPLGPTAPPSGVRFVGRPAAARDPKGRLELFVAGEDGMLYRSWQVTPEGGFVAWTPQFGGVRPGIAIARNQDGRLEVFAAGSDQRVRVTWQAEPGGEWVEPLEVTGVDVGPGGLAAATNADGRVELFAIDSGGSLRHRWQVDAGRGPWSDWVALAGAPTATSITATAIGGRVHLWAIGADGEVHEDSQRDPQPDPDPNLDPQPDPQLDPQLDPDLDAHPDREGGWGEWVATGPEPMRTGLTTAVARTPHGDAIDLFATGPDGQATWRRRQSSAGTWTAWEPVPAP